MPLAGACLMCTDTRTSPGPSPEVRWPMLCIPAGANRQENNPLTDCRESWQRVALRRPAEVVAVLDAVLETLRAAGYSHKEQFGVRLALEEAVVNALKHGHRGDLSKQVQVRYRVEAARVTVE